MPDVDRGPEQVGRSRHTLALEKNAREHDQAVEQFKWRARKTAEVLRGRPNLTAEMLESMAANGELLRFVDERLTNEHRVWYPAWQFDEEGVRTELPAILETLAEFSSDAVACDRIMQRPLEELGDRCLADILAMEGAWEMANGQELLVATRNSGF